MPSLLDPNLHPFRKDLAATSLKGLVEADRFVDGVAFQVTGGLASLRKQGTEDAEQLSQALHGDVIIIFEEVAGFGWGQMASDGYVGWFDMAALSSPVLPVTRKVKALRTYAYAHPSAKAQPHYLLSMGAQICETGERENGFVFCARAGWVYDAHLAPLDQYVTDPVELALKFLDAPYQWGGVESLGLDCSGLVQTCFKAAGIAMPRDSYMQREIGRPVAFDSNLNDLKRGDIVCWRGHVAIMVDTDDIVHSNGFHLKVAREALHEAKDRIGAQYGGILTIRRLF
jgi:cell wall-associated NlpC family hydrolase